MSVSEGGKCRFSFHYLAEDWPSELETNMHSMLGSFFNSAVILKYLDIFIQYVTGNAFILFDPPISLFEVNHVLFFFKKIGFIFTVVPVSLF